MDENLKEILNEVLTEAREKLQAWDIEATEREVMKSPEIMRLNAEIAERKAILRVFEN